MHLRVLFVAGAAVLVTMPDTLGDSAATVSQQVVCSPLSGTSIDDAVISMIVAGTCALPA